MDQLNIFLVGIAGISLLVGGIGIMNIMLVSGHRWRPAPGSPLRGPPSTRTDPYAGSQHRAGEGEAKTGSPASGETRQGMSGLRLLVNCCVARAERPREERGLPLPEGQ